MDLTANSSSPQFIFPILKSTDILQCMFELGIEMSKEELMEPQRHKEKLRQIFVQLVRNLQYANFSLVHDDGRCGYNLV
jgi:hypothetical protein